jgi:hypothetical protein
VNLRAGRVTTRGPFRLIEPRGRIDGQSSRTPRQTSVLCGQAPTIPHPRVGLAALSFSANFALLTSDEIHEDLPRIGLHGIIDPKQLQHPDSPIPALVLGDERCFAEERRGRQITSTLCTGATALAMRPVRWAS